jgi:phosphopantetheinyl transferase (holo-ACP synthase)
MHGQMEVNMAMDREVVTIHTMNTIHRSGQVFYASLPCGPCKKVPDNGHRTNGEEDRQRLVSVLWDCLAATESPFWKRCQSSNRAEYPIRVVHGVLGRPHLLCGEHQGPAVSFSKGGGRVWAALAGDESDIGIDVAGTDEFQGEYPFHRVFHPQELQHASRLADGDLEKTSALLWSVKEAVVKALGCAFHLADPLQITIGPSLEREAEVNAGYTFLVNLSEKALLRFSVYARRQIWVRSFPRGKIWLSIAVINRGASGHE